MPQYIGQTVFHHNSRGVNLHLLHLPLFGGLNIRCCIPGEVGTCLGVRRHDPLRLQQKKSAFLRLETIFRIKTCHACKKKKKILLLFPTGTEVHLQSG